MYENITKKEFIDILKKSENEILYTNSSLFKAGFTKIIDILYDGKFEVKKARKCIGVNSNSLMFDDGSKLYFNSVKNCLRKNNMILTYSEDYDIFEECHRYSIISYVIK